MRTNLGNAINNAYFEARNALRRRDASPEVRVYVEGLPDVAFWNVCFMPWKYKYNFKISTYRREDEQGAFHSLHGKQNLLNAFSDNKLGPNLLLAIDADYDWIFDDYRPSLTHPDYSVSRRIRDNKYILHTYLYGIENYQCHPFTLDSLWTTIAGHPAEWNWMEIMEEWSETMADLFMLHMVSMEQGDGSYPLKTLKEWMTNFKIPFGYCRDDMAVLRKKVKEEYRRHRSYEQTHLSNINELRRRLAQKGFHTKDYFMVIQGHALKGCGVMQGLPGQIHRVRKVYLEEIKREGNGEEREKLLKQYSELTGVDGKNRIQDIGTRIESVMTNGGNITQVKKGYQAIERDIANIFGSPD